MKKKKKKLIQNFKSLLKFYIYTPICTSKYAKAIFR